MRKSLQNTLDWYLERLSPRKTDARVKDQLFDIQTAINAGETEHAWELLAKLPQHEIYQQTGGHVLKDSIRIKDKVYKVHGLLLQSEQSSNFYLYDLDANDITYYIPVAESGLRPMRPAEKDKPLVYLSAPSAVAAATATASTSKRQSHELSPVSPATELHRQHSPELVAKQSPFIPQKPPRARSTVRMEASPFIPQQTGYDDVTKVSHVTYDDVVPQDPRQSSPRQAGQVGQRQTGYDDVLPIRKKSYIELKLQPRSHYTPADSPSN